MSSQRGKCTRTCSHPFSTSTEYLVTCATCDSSSSVFVYGRSPVPMFSVTTTTLGASSRRPLRITTTAITFTSHYRIIRTEHGVQRNPYGVRSKLISIAVNSPFIMIQNQIIVYLT